MANIHKLLLGEATDAMIDMSLEDLIPIAAELLGKDNATVIEARRTLVEDFDCKLRVNLP